MPSATEILDVLAKMSRELEWLAIAWHVGLLAAVVAVVAGFRPKTRTATLLLATPPLSVALGSLSYGNGFNAASFGLLASLLSVLAVAGVGRNAERVEAGPAWAVSLGALLFVFGWCYPHFNTVPWYRPLYAAPVGVVPCPTLAVVAGCALAGGGFRSRALPGIVAVWCAFYALFGIFRLGVWVDAALAVAAVGLVGLMMPARYAAAESKS